MQSTNERPVCHRAEDLVTFLYGEAGPAEARDFSAHMERCEACRTEFGLFNQVHKSIVTWRNEALGSAAAIPAPVSVPAAAIHQPERRLSAWAALREFFAVSPLWLRGATAFAGLLLCVLLVFAASRLWEKPVDVVRTDNPAANQQKFDQAVEQEVQKRLAELAQRKGEQETVPVKNQESDRGRMANNRVRSKRPKGLTQEERVQLAADLGLISGREEELPFVLPEEPDQ
jgi:anti-sigma factor RsiW